MIISHKYKFIFIKTNKTAGTSVEIALSKFCGPDDIITPISNEDEQIRQRLGYKGAQNHKGFYNHISAKKIKASVSKHVWNNYYKFCIERNPWDRLISFYYFINKLDNRPSIQEFIDQDIVLRLKQNGYENYTINNIIAVDKICRYEKLNTELTDVAKKISLPSPLELPLAKSNFRLDKRHYSEVIDTYTRDKVSQIFEKEIKMFNYTF